MMKFWNDSEWNGMTSSGTDQVSNGVLEPTRKWSLCPSPPSSHQYIPIATNIVILKPRYLSKKRKSNKKKRET